MMFFDASDHKYHMCNLRSWFSYVPSNTTNKNMSRLMRKFCEKPDVCERLSSPWARVKFSLTWRDKGGPYFSVGWMPMGHGNPGVEFQKCSYITFSPINTNKTDAFLSHFFDPYFQGLVHGTVR